MKDLVASLPTHRQLVDPCITPRFVPTCSSKLLDGLAMIAEEGNLRIQSHMAESAGQVAWVRGMHDGKDDSLVLQEVCRSQTPSHGRCSPAVADPSITHRSTGSLILVPSWRTAPTPHLATLLDWPQQVLPLPIVRSPTSTSRPSVDYLCTKPSTQAYKSVWDPTSREAINSGSTTVCVGQSEHLDYELEMLENPLERSVGKSLSIWRRWVELRHLDWMIVSDRLRSGSLLMLNLFSSGERGARWIGLMRDCRSRTCAKGGGVTDVTQIGRECGYKVDVCESCRHGVLITCCPPPIVLARPQRSFANLLSRSGSALLCSSHFASFASGQTLSPALASSSYYNGGCK